ncbi:hypothetical protein SAMN04515679_0894 [Pelosinus fermentans]|uniref:Uncharacterized protein n=1 Tax=Pelosinus fermentans B4 TaxID=1149862 RepID=I9LKD5_9FIRM|nr:hypothetical protein FB4_1743 [Pelosinus fermentans B4]EIW27242.1 hypothetical protein FA11_1261 [Pelosinus fermentans A11]OAM92823.1 hypothetical protein FR7_00839 [Pelosinus fermentans DSM 17108]SDQ58004.1 hypothetical protein SAMN04515679_0894 [Pelosinus fermentans]
MGHVERIIKQTLGLHAAFGNCGEGSIVNFG